MSASGPNAAMPDAPPLVGLVPMAGAASRLGSLPCSKEVFPVGFGAGEDGGPRPKPACFYLLEQFARAGVARAILVLRTGKWDVAAVVEDGRALGLPVAYVVTPPTAGVPHTLDRAWPFVAGARVAFGFPDILFTADDVFVRLERRQRTSGADVALAAVPAREPARSGMIGIAADGRVVGVVEKPALEDLDPAWTHMWAAAVWSPRFTRFLHDRLHDRQHDRQHDFGHQDLAARSTTAEPNLGQALAAAIGAGLAVVAEVFDDAGCRDIGTPEALRDAVRDYAR
jgi:glucose-1-phosphate thymidylyltransferase